MLNLLSLISFGDGLTLWSWINYGIITVFYSLIVFSMSPCFEKLYFTSPVKLKFLVWNDATTLVYYNILQTKRNDRTLTLTLVCIVSFFLSTTFSWKNPIFFVHIREKNLQKNHRKMTVFRLIWSYEFWVVFRTGFGLILA